MTQIRCTLVCALAVGLALGPTIAPARPAQPTYSVVDRIPGADGDFDYASFDAPLRRLFIGRADRVTAVDVDRRRVTERLLDGKNVHANLVLPGGRRVLSTHGDSDRAVLFDAETGRILATAATGKHPDAAAYDRATDSAWVADYLGGSLTMIDAGTGRVRGTVTVGPHPEAPVADGKGRLFVNTGQHGVYAVAEIDVRTRKVVGHYPLGDCQGASGLAFVPRYQILASVCRSGVLAILSAKDGHELKRIAIGTGADGAIYDARRKRLLIPVGDTGELDVLAIKGPAAVEQVATVPTKRGAATAALDPVTGRVYLPTATFDPPGPGSDEPVARPGSFEVLVLSPAD